MYQLSFQAVYVSVNYWASYLLGLLGAFFMKKLSSWPCRLQKVKICKQISIKNRIFCDFLHFTIFTHLICDILSRISPSAAHDHMQLFYFCFPNLIILREGEGKKTPIFLDKFWYFLKPRRKWKPCKNFKQGPSEGQGGAFAWFFRPS